MSEVWEYAPLVGTDLLVLLALADMANDDTRECWPGYKSISHKARISTRQVANVVTELQTQGIVNITDRLRPDGGATSKLYHINVIDEWAVLAAYDKFNEEVSPRSTVLPPLEAQFYPPKSVAPSKVHTNRNGIPKVKGESRKRSTPRTETPMHPLIAAWATCRGIDAVNIGAPIFTTKDLALAKRMAKWDSPPTTEEITTAVKVSKADKYPFMWLEQDIPKQRLNAAPKPQDEPKRDKDGLTAYDRARLQHMEVTGEQC